MARRRRRRSPVGLPWIKSSPRRRTASPHQDTGGVLKAIPLFSDHFPSKKSKRRVSFDRNVVKHAPTMMKDDCQALWYTRQDIYNFRQDTQEAVEYRKSLGTSAWTEDYMGVYEAVAACGDYATARILIDCAVVDLATASFDVHALGLEKLACPHIVQDIKGRREQLHLQVGAIQASPDRVEHAREASRTLSRPCVLYAQCVAQMAAAVDVA